MNFAEGGEGEVDGVVLGVAPAAEGLRLHVEDADDGEDVALAIDISADGRSIGEKVFGGIVAEDRHVGGALFFGFGPQAAGDKLQIGHFLHVGGGAIEDGVLDLVRTVP